VQEISLYIKKHTVTAVNSCVDGTPCPLIMQESTIVHAFYQYFDHYWESISRIQREREGVLNQLSQLVQ
jgi:hypothetical protein